MTAPAAACFLDSSAVTKLIIEERESGALASRLSGCRLVGSALLVPEVSRAVRRVVGRRRDAQLAEVLDLLDLVTIDRGVLDSAADLAPAGMRTLDAIHLACALVLGGRITAFIGYDNRLLAAAHAAGLVVESPAPPG